MFRPRNNSLRHVSVGNSDDVSPSLGSRNYAGSPLESPVWHPLLLGSIQDNCHPVSFFVSMHYSSDEEPTPVPLVLAEDASGSSSRPLCAGDHVLTTPLLRKRATCGAFLRTRMLFMHSFIVYILDIEPNYFAIGSNDTLDRRFCSAPIGMNQLLDVCSSLAPEGHLYFFFLHFHIPN